DRGEIVGEEALDVGGICGRADGRHRLHLLDPRGGDERGGTAEAVSDEQPRPDAAAAEPVRGGDEVLDVRGEVGVARLVAPAEAGEVEAEHAEALLGEGTAQPRGGAGLPGAGEAMGEDGTRVRRALRPVEPGVERPTARPRK